MLFQRVLAELRKGQGKADKKEVEIIEKN